MDKKEPHKCDEKCLCPIHKTPMFYAPYASGPDLHACQEVDCIYGHGYESILNDEVWRLYMKGKKHERQ